MKYDYFLFDVFTNKLFNGAQIAVFPKADSLNSEKMQAIAKELNQSETVFIQHRNNEPFKRRMRVFSPFKEIDFGGHPIIAAAYTLGLNGDIALSDNPTKVWFEQNVGAIEVNINSTHGKPDFVQFSRTVTPLVDRFAPAEEEVISFLNLKPSELDHHKYSPRLISCGFPYLVIPVWNYDSVRKARFNLQAWSQSVAPQTAAQEIILFAPKSPFPDADFNIRLLGPYIGPYDDPPIGSALPAFCAYLCSFEHTRKGTHTFAVDRGDINSRRSIINLEMDNKYEPQLTVRIGGQAVLSAKGEFYIG